MAKAVRCEYGMGTGNRRGHGKEVIILLGPEYLCYMQPLICIPLPYTISVFMACSNPVPSVEDEKELYKKLKTKCDYQLGIAHRIVAETASREEVARALFSLHPLLCSSHPVLFSYDPDK